MAGISRAEANQRLKTVNIKGKEYVPVDARILAFWDVFPEGSIVTEWIVLDEERAVCKATVSNMGVELATGTASELRGASAINRTSYVENCETSAIGRALGIAGIGTDGSIASADEVASAASQQAAAQQAAAQQAPDRAPEDASIAERALAFNAYKTALRQYCDRTGKDEQELLAQQEAHFGAEVTEWSTDTLRSMADKFPKGGAQ